MVCLSPVGYGVNYNPTGDEYTISTFPTGNKHTISTFDKNFRLKKPTGKGVQRTPLPV